MISDVILQYEAALQRLVENKPNILPPGSKITINNVALEAGRGKGSIRKDRECFDQLREKTKAAAAKQKKKIVRSPTRALKSCSKISITGAWPGN